MDIAASCIAGTPSSLAPAGFAADSLHLRSTTSAASNKVVDLLLLSLTMLWVVLSPELSTHGYHLNEVLGIRVSMVNFILAAACILIWQFAMRFTMADDGAPAGSAARIARLLTRVTVCTVVAGIVLWWRHPQLLSTANLLEFWAISLFLLGTARIIRRGLSVYITPRFRHERRVIIVGSGSRARGLGSKLQAHPKKKYAVVGFVDSEPQFEGQELLGKTSDLDAILMREIVDEVLIALPMKSKYTEIQTAIAACEAVGVQSSYSMDLFNTEVAKCRSIEPHHPSSIVLHMVHDDHRRYLKRSLDILGAGICLLLFSPLMALVAIAVKLTSRGPVIFKQQRLGLNKRPFQMYKFRSMVSDAEAKQKELEHLNEVGGPVFKISKDPRITAIGHLIRKTSIDELPQLVNVLFGEMSLVGPRPLPLRDVNRFAESWLMRRFSVRPGMTGLWQVSGRSKSTFSSWMKFDLEYIDQWSLYMDFKILALTFPAVLKRDGAA